MDEHWHDLLSSLEIVGVVLVGAHLAHDDGVDALQVGRVGEHFDREVLTHIVFGEASTQVILDVA